MDKVRVQEYGVTSYWPKGLAGAVEVANTIMNRNGCGNIQQRQPDGTWKLTHRFEPWYGVVAA